MRARLPALAALVAGLALAGAACGGGGGDTPGPHNGNPEAVPEGAVAVVAGVPIERAAFDRFFNQARAAYEAQGRTFPSAGTPEYDGLRSQAVQLLIERVEFAKEAELLGITVTDEEVAERLTELKDQFFGGDQAAYDQELEDRGLTDEDIRADIRAQLLNQKLYEEVTKAITVDDADVRTYYDEHLDEFTTPESREVAHILVDTRTEADELYQELQDGGDFAALAEEHSKDQTSAVDGGKLTARRGELVTAFEEVAFDLETGAISEPVETEFGWHLITALGDVEPEQVTPFPDVSESIREQLLQERRNAEMSRWVSEVRAKYAGQISYAVGFQPPPPSAADTDTGSGDTAPADTSP